VNVAQLRAVADAWNSSSLKEAYAQWTKNATHANVGPLNGLRNYYRGDYFVRYTPFWPIGKVAKSAFRFGEARTT
jgi:hypothetical protein